MLHLQCNRALLDYGLLQAPVLQSTFTTSKRQTSKRQTSDRQATIKRLTSDELTVTGTFWPDIFLWINLLYTVNTQRESKASKEVDALQQGIRVHLSYRIIFTARVNMLYLIISCNFATLIFKGTSQRLL